MTGRERCDEILRLIDQALAECEEAGGTRPKPVAGRQAVRAAERLAEAVAP